MNIEAFVLVYKIAQGLSKVEPLRVAGSVIQVNGSQVIVGQCVS